LFLTVWAWWFFFVSRRNNSGVLPPGPRPLPVVGNIFQLDKNPHRCLAKLAQQYGPLMSLRFGSVYTVVVSSPEMAREVLQKHDLAFSSRTIVAAGEAHDHHKLAMGFMPVGDKWRSIRKLCKEQVFSLGRLEASQSLREEKLRKLVDYVGECGRGGRAVGIGEAAFITTLNLMSATLFSAEFAVFDSDSGQEFKETIEGIATVLGVPNLADSFPILKPFDPQGIKKKAGFYFGKLLAMIGELIDERKKSRSGNDYSRKQDFLEALLDCSENELTIDEMKHLLMDFLVAGTDTTSSTTEWAMAELLKHPEKLKKTQREIRSIVGSNERIRESDISKLPYFQAVIKEVFRLHPPAPLMIPHKSESDVEVGDYTIPRGTQVLINVWALGRDPKIWERPDSFEPERFLNSNKKMDFKGQNFELIPFGSGRRICPGLPLADRMVHIMVASLLHQFDWKLDAGMSPEMVDRAEKFGLSLTKLVPLKAIPLK
ncbi:hypothetical protein M569_07486, partial [Genlisea aurea]